MKYTLLTLLVLSSLLLAGCSPSASAPTNTNPTVNTPSSSDNNDMDEKNEDNENMNENDDDKNDAGEDKNDDDDMNDAAANTVPEDTTTVYAMSDIIANNTESSCRTTIRGNVYNLSAWIDAHPGGDRNILRLCGIDGTAAFEGKHGGKEGPETTLAGFQIGVLQ